MEYNRTRQKETRQTLKILRIRWPDTISNEELHGRAETTKAMEVIIQTRWSWISHALRMDKSRIGTTALKWQSEGNAQTTKNNMEKDGRDRKRHTRDEQLSKAKTVAKGKCKQCIRAVCVIEKK